MRRLVWTLMVVMVAMVWSAAASPTIPTRAPSVSPRVVVLQPGILGFKELHGLGSYWGEVPRMLRAKGITVVERAPAPVQSPRERAAELAADVRRVREQTGAGPVVIIAHSQGGIDVRAALAFEEGFAADVGAVATIASPHHGSAMVDVGEALPAPVTDGVLRGVHALFEADQGLTPRTADPRGALAGLSNDGARDLGVAMPHSPVPFFSIGGVTGADVDGACLGGLWSPPEVTDLAAPTAVWNLWATTAVRGPHSTDGVVPTSSMRFGTFLGCAPADHGDWLGWPSHPLEEELVWSPTPFLSALAVALLDVQDVGERAMDYHLPTLAQHARARVIDAAPAP